MNKSTVLTFIDQVKQEAAKVIWPTKKETIASTMMVVVMVVLCSLFFLLMDSIINYLVQIMLKVGI
jgi:preprotein translocase subunit SecE